MINHSSSRYRNGQTHAFVSAAYCFTFSTTATRYAMLQHHHWGCFRRQPSCCGLAQLDVTHCKAVVRATAAVSRRGPCSTSCSSRQAGLSMAHRPNPQHRLRLLVHQQATPSGSPSRADSGTLQSGMGTPAASPTKGAVSVVVPQQQQQQEEQLAGGGGNPQWWLLVVTAALGIVICYADRSNVSTAILPMAETFGWDKTFQGIVLSAFFAGYAATQVLGGSLADKYGGKPVLTAGVALWSLFTVVTPQAAAAGTAPLMAARVLLGVGEGVAFPAIHSMIARNVPTSNRSTAVGVITAASYAGTALAFGLSPLLITKFGWQWVFYLFGGAALVWLPFWLPLNVYSRLPGGGSSSSRKSGKTSPDGIVEQQPLLPGTASSSSTALAGPSGGNGSSSGVDAAAGDLTGFRALMQRREVWAICVCQFTQSYAMYGLLNWLPTFFSEYYEVQVGDLAGYTLLPYFVQGLVGLGAGALADQLITKQGWSVRSVRVGLQLAGMLGPAACLMAAVSPLVGGSATAASALITVGLGLSALTLGAVSVNHLDIAPRHAGMIFGAGNTAGTLAGLVGVPFTGWLLQRTASWPLVFGLIAANFVVGSAVWAAWVGDKQLPEDGKDQPTAPSALAP